MTTSAMSLNRRRLLALAGAASGAAILAGMPVPARAQGSGKLTVWVFDQTTSTKLKEGFPLAYPGYELEIVQMPAADLIQRLVIALQGGQGLPDVVQILTRETGALFATGQFMDMTAELEPLRANFPEGILLDNEGELITFIQGPGNMGFWVNRAALETHGLAIDPEGTWADVVAVARELKEKSGGKSHLFIQPPGANGFLMFNGFFNARGGNWWDASGNLVADAELAADTLQFFVDLKTEGLSYDTVWSAPNYWDLIKDNTIVGYTMNYAVGSTNLKRNVPDQSGQWQLVTWPRWSAGEPQRTGNFGGHVYAALRNAPNPQGAKDVVMWWLSEAGIKAQFETVGTLAYAPARDVVDLNIPDPYFGGQTVLSDLISVPFPQFYYQHWTETTSAMTNAVDQALSGAKTAREAIDEALAELRAI
ncbi:MAG: ABC transporter substrate-binding protein [Devosia sp.]